MVPLQQFGLGVKFPFEYLYRDCIVGKAKYGYTLSPNGIPSHCTWPIPRLRCGELDLAVCTSGQEKLSKIIQLIRA